MEEKCILIITRKQRNYMQCGKNIFTMGRCVMLPMSINIQSLYCQYCGRKIELKESEDTSCN